VRPLIELSHISCRFAGAGGETITALDDISVTIPSGQFIVVIGPNGSGKSTLLNVLAGSVQPVSGSWTIDGRDMTGQKEFSISRRVARVFQDPGSGTAGAMTILENLRLASLRSQTKSLRTGLTRPFREAMRQKVATLGLGLEDRLDQPAATLSGGQRQALSLLMTTLDRSGLLLLDEPTAALDPKTASVIMELAARIVRDNNLTAVLVTHRMKDALAYGDRLLCLRAGTVERDISRPEEKMKLRAEDLYAWFDA
jgi:putative ABC transport system ATP-binding protein